MMFDVHIDELLSEINKFDIEEIKNDVTGKVLVRFNNYVSIGEGHYLSKIFSVLISCDDNMVKTVVLYLISDPSKTQDLWTYILNHGFLNLELYPIMIDEDSLPIKLFLAPIKY